MTNAHQINIKNDSEQTKDMKHKSNKTRDRGLSADSIRANAAFWTYASISDRQTIIVCTNGSVFAVYTDCHKLLVA